MPVKPIPDGYHAVTPYLVVRNAAGLMDFLAAAFGATVKERVARPDGAIMHAEMRIGDSLVMMGEASAEHPAQPASLHLYVADADATYKAALAAGATSVRAPTDQFYGDRTGGVRDPAGNTWWIATHVEDVTPAELVARAASFMAKQS